MSDRKIIDGLNTMLAQEHACAIRYATHAATVSGPYSETVAARLAEIAGDELLHAEKLRERILAMGGTPTMEVDGEGLTPADDLSDILRVNIEEEKDAVVEYTKIFDMVEPSNVILYQTLQELIRDEQEHIEELEALTRAG